MSITIDCEFLAETDNAIRVLCIDIDEKVWFPFSHVEKIERKQGGKGGNATGSITVTDWIARQRGFDVD